MLRNDDEVHAESFGDTEDRAEVLRIGDAVEDENELPRLDRLIEIRIRRFGHFRDDAVVYAARGEAIDLLARHRPHVHAALLRFADELLMPRRLLARDADVAHALGMRADRLEDRIDAVDDHRPGESIERDEYNRRRCRLERVTRRGRSSSP